MATPDFSKVWASNSPLPDYTFSDADYLTGWDFVGSAPPTKNEFDAWFKATDEKLNWLYNQLQTTASKLYPVGSVYISFNATDPTTLFGGTWVRMKDRVLMASGDTYAPNTTGGSATVTLTTSNLPSHNHSITTDGAHVHTATSASAGTHNHTVSGSIANAGDHTHTWSGSSASAGDHTHTWTGSSASAGSHNHTWTGSSASAGAHTHTITASASSVGAHTHDRGTMEIIGTYDYGRDNDVYHKDDAFCSGAFAAGAEWADTRNYLSLATNPSANNWKKMSFVASRSWTGNTSSNGAHTHTITASCASDGAHTHAIVGSIVNNGAHIHTLSGSNTSAGAHTHTISGSNTNNGTHTHTWSGSIGNNGAHTHTITVASNGSHTHTIGNTGGGLPVNTLPPYMTVYMWRRTA